MTEWRRKRNGGEVRPRNEARDFILDPALPKPLKLVLKGYFKHLIDAVLFSTDKLMPKELMACAGST